MVKKKEGFVVSCDWTCLWLNNDVSLCIVLIETAAGLFPKCVIVLFENAGKNVVCTGKSVYAGGG